MAWKRQSKEEKERLYRRRRRQLIGAVLSLLIVVGVVTVIGTLGKNIGKLFDNTKEKTHYQTIVAPLVMLDPVPFDALETADPNLLLQAAIWETIFNEDITKYDRDEYGALMLPTVDIDKNGALMYGKTYKLTHATFSASGMEFAYNPDTASYIIPITGTTGSYTPQIEKIKSSVKEKIVTVGYLAPANGFSMEGTTDTTKPAKYYDYVFTRQDDGYFLTAITESAMKAEGQIEAVSSQPAAAPGELADEIMQKAAQAAAESVPPEGAVPSQPAA
ncbi:MAG: hypothetical protein RR075_04685 [Pygmaiobacter sp.]